METPPRQIESVRVALEILNMLKENDGARIRDLDEQLDVSKGTIHTHLNTLRADDYVTKEGNTYKLGLQWVPMGEYVRNRVDLYIAGKEKIDQLARQTGETLHLMVPSYPYEITLYEAQGEKAVAPNYYLRMREEPQHLHVTSAGKAILSQLPEERVEAIIDEVGLPAKTENTITDPDELFEELAEIRERGYAINREEEIKGMCAAGAPVLDPDGEVLGSVALSVPSNRMDSIQHNNKYPEIVTDASNVIEVEYSTADESLGLS
jgi:DNA-binding IclR family transcriptional regulator